MGFYLVSERKHRFFQECSGEFFQHLSLELHDVIENVSTRPPFAPDPALGPFTLTAPSIRDRGLPRFPHSFSRLPALRGLFESRLALPLVGQELVPDLVEIVRQDPQPDVPLKASPPFVGTPIQPMVFQGIDVRFDRTVLLA